MILSKVRNARRWAPTGPRAWLCAVLALVIAIAVRGALQPILGAAAPGFVFCMAAALTSYFYGLAPGLLVMVAGLGIADDLFVPPYGDITVFDRSDLVLVLTYPIVTTLIIVLIERLRRAQYRAELVGSVAQSRYEMLLRSDNERLLAKRDADETHRLLRALTQRHQQLIFIQALTPGVTLPGHRDATQPGSRFNEIHPEDIERVLTVLTPGPHRVRTRNRAGSYEAADAVCERFATPSGDFVILRFEAA